MKFDRRVVLLSAGLGVIALAGVAWLVDARGEGGGPQYRTARVDRGAIIAAVSATGTLNALVTVQVGSQQSGQIRELSADFNTRVRAGQVLARLDSEAIEARLLQAQADLTSARAQVEMQRAAIARAEADILNARANRERADSAAREALRESGRQGALLRSGTAASAAVERAQSSAEQARASLAAAQAQEAATVAALRNAQAQLQVAEAAVVQREATVRLMEVELDRAAIRSPIDGVVVQRSIDLGQTVAASFQAPTLFTIAHDLSEMEVWASVDEGDIGRVAPGQEVTFTVAAHPGRTFAGRVKQVRLASQTVSNVVTYTVVIGAANPEQRLLPGMTATVRIITERRADAVRLPTAALRFRPPGARPPAAGESAAERGRPGIAGQVWVLAAGAPRALDIRLGISDGTMTEILAGLETDREVIIGTIARGAATTAPRQGS